MSCRTLVLNDHHVGVERTGGTTISSAAALRSFALEKHTDCMNLATTVGAKRVIVNGDLSDTYSIALAQALELYVATHQFMLALPDIEVVWALGNHDLSKDSSKLGTVAFIGALLRTLHPGQFTLVDRPMALDDDTYVIPHLVNQEAFDAALEEVPASTKWLYLHCNYDNVFAGQADHSLNLAREQAKELTRGGTKIILGHEHQGRELMAGKVIIVGNQFPTSVADCLSHGDAQRDGRKRAIVVDGDSWESVTTWTPDDEDGWFARVDWKELKDIEEEGRGFIRVEGEAAAGQSTDAIRAIAAFRSKAQSYVVTNAVRTEQVEGLRDLADSIEDIKSINVIDMLLEYLTPEQRDVITSLRSTT